MTHSLQEEGQGGTGPSGIQCLKQNVRERQKTDPCGFSLGRSKMCGFVRGRPVPRGSGGLQGAGEGRTGDPPPAPRPWALHGPAALAGALPARVGVGELAPSGPAGRVSRQQLYPWRSERSALENSGCLGALAAPCPLGLASHLATACAGTLFFTAKASPSCPSQGHRPRVAPGWTWSKLPPRGCLTAKPDSLE